MHGMSGFHVNSIRRCKGQGRVAEKWSTPDYQISASDLNCTICFGADGDIFKHCLTCEVRKCGTEKAVANCAYCDEYTCDKLDKLWKTLGSADAKKTLDDIKSEL
jgi:uncharacterized protein DUF3795